MSGLARRATAGSLSTAVAGQQAAPEIRVPAPRRRVDIALVLLLVTLGAATVAAAVLSNGSAAAAVAPVLATLMIWALVKLPLRVPVLILMFITLTFDTPAEAFVEGRYKSPFLVVTNLLLNQLKQTIPSGALVFSGMDVVLVVLFLLNAYRRGTLSRIDRKGFVATPLPLIAGAFIALGGVAFAFAHGLVTGGVFRFSLWQIQRTIYLPLMFLLFQMSMTRRNDYVALGRLVVLAACVRSLVAIWLETKFPDAEYMTSHSDSMLFGTAVCILLLRFMVAPKKGQMLSTFGLLGLIGWGIVANDRRLAWAEIGLACMFLFFLTPWNKLKLKFVRALVIASPVIMVYMAVGWGTSGTGIFKPVGIVRSMVDSKSDTSTLWRDLENFNLVQTLKSSPVAGLGLGHPMKMVIEMPDVTDAYELEPYLPHNSIMGLWAFQGYVGFCMFWSLVVIGLYLAARTTFHATTPPLEKVACLSAFACITIYMLQCYGDMGLGSWPGVYLVSAALTVAGKLAMANGAWTLRPEPAPKPAAA